MPRVRMQNTWVPVCDHFSDPCYGKLRNDKGNCDEEGSRRKHAFRILRIGCRGADCGRRGRNNASGFHSLYEDPVDVEFHFALLFASRSWVSRRPRPASPCTDSTRQGHTALPTIALDV